MINISTSYQSKHSGGFILITTLVFLAVITLLALHSAQLATQDLLLAGNVQQRALAEQAALLELSAQRTQLGEAPQPGHPVQTIIRHSGSITLLGCYASPWVPLESPQAATSTAYAFYKTQVVADGPGGSKAHVLAIVPAPIPPAACQAE